MDHRVFGMVLAFISFQCDKPSSEPSAEPPGAEDRVGGDKGVEPTGPDPSPTPLLPGNTIAAGHRATCARYENDTIACWGDMLAQAVRPDADPLRPYVIKNLRAGPRSRLALGGAHGCIIVGDDGVVRCWGRNQAGQLGAESAQPDDVIAVSLPRPARAVAAGADHSCAVLDSGEIYCWGNNYEGQLGNGGTSVRSSPTPVVGIRSAVEVTAGGDFTCARLADGTARCWGRNFFGKLGDGTTQWRLYPVAVGGLTEVVELVAGGVLTCARKRPGTVHCWGSNTFGSLGQGTADPDDHPTPQAVQNLTDAVQLGAGAAFACALRAGGQVVCWGYNHEGQLGEGTGRQRMQPTPVVGLSDIAELTVGQNHACARRASGEAWCWGLNKQGQLGDGTTEQRLEPRPVRW